MLPAMLPKKFSCGAEGAAFPPAPSAGAERGVLYSGRLFPGSELERLLLGTTAALAIPLPCITQSLASPFAVP